VKCIINACFELEDIPSQYDSAAEHLILGLPMIERVFREAKRAGLKDFVLISQEQDTQLRQNCDELVKQLKGKLSHIQGDGQQSQIANYLQAQDLEDDQFILLNANQLFDSGNIKKLANKKPDLLSQADLILLADSNILNKTGVQAEANRIAFKENNPDQLSDYGLHIADFTAYDTGIYFANKSIFNHMKRLNRQNDDATLYDLVSQLTTKNKVQALSIKSDFWCPIKSASAIKQAEALLIARLCYHDKEDSIVVKHIYRPITLHTISWLAKVKLKSLHLSLVSVVSALIICLLFAYGSYATLLFGGILTLCLANFQLSVQAVAKVRFERTPYTRWCKEVLNKYTEVLLLLGMMVHGVSSWQGDMHSFAIGAFAIVGILLFHYSRDKYIEMVNNDPPKNHDLYMNWSTRWFVIAIGAAINLPLLALTVLAIILNGLVIRRFFSWRV
jgi:choline kinase